MKKLNTVLVYDEGDTTFSKHAEQVMLGYPTASTLFTTSRSSGIGAVVITHQPHKVITSLRSEAYTKIFFNLSDAEDARYMGQACSLSREEQEMISKLPNYHSIVATRRISKPFIIKTFNKADEIRKNPVIIKNKTREKIAELQRSVIPRKPSQENIQISSRENRSLPISVQESPPLYFAMDARKLLENIHEHPFLTTVERYKQLGFSASKGNKALKVLEEKNLINKVPLKTKRGRGGISSFLEFTQDGLMALGKKKQPYKGKGNLKHCYYAKNITEFYEKKGYEAKQEYQSCDVAINSPDGLVAVEVCIHLSNIQKNIQRNMDNGFIKTILVFENKDSLQRTKANIQQSKNIEFKIIDEYLE